MVASRNGKSTRLMASLRALSHRLANFLVCLVLAQRIHRPDRRGNPANQSQLKEQTEDAGEGTPDGEKGEPRQYEGDEQSHWLVPVVAKV